MILCLVYGKAAKGGLKHLIEISAQAFVSGLIGSFYNPLKTNEFIICWTAGKYTKKSLSSALYTKK